MGGVKDKDTKLSENTVKLVLEKLKKNVVFPYKKKAEKVKQKGKLELEHSDIDHNDIHVLVDTK